MCYNFNQVFASILMRRIAYNFSFFLPLCFLASNVLLASHKFETALSSVFLERFYVTLVLAIHRLSGRATWPWCEGSRSHGFGRTPQGVKGSFGALPSFRTPTFTSALVSSYTCCVHSAMHLKDFYKCIFTSRWLF